ncbi:MAG TPA: HD domain-containing protein [Candidatus Polarisedimenticolia bacterium]|nr:HD domain-containing protein [Candidatus Polarisedimenticolia bacterium]
MELTREELEKDEDQRLAPYALRSAAARRGVRVGPEGRIFDYRTEFQRDRDRILHSRAFRRLRLKSHGGAFPPAERYRDRLTHTLAVSQMCRTVARGLGLNEDLVEAIALGHEVGMPPFGPHGEAALGSLLAGVDGGFSYAVQSLRVVDRLEKRYAHEGLNLTDATREGILKHAGWPPPEGSPAAPPELSPQWAPLFEAQVVAAVEPAARAIEDLDDGLRAGDVDSESVERLPIVRELMRRVAAAPARGPGRRAAGRAAMNRRANLIHRGLTHMLVTGIIHHSRRTLRAWAREHAVTGPRELLRARPHVQAGMVGLTPAAARMYDGLGDFVSRHLHQGAWLSAAASRARHLLGALFRALADNPRLAEDYMLLRFKQDEGGPYLRDVPPAAMEAELARRYRGSRPFARIVADHIAGMTDLFTVAEHERLLGPFAMGGKTP